MKYLFLFLFAFISLASCKSDETTTKTTLSTATLPPVFQENNIPVIDGAKLTNEYSKEEGKLHEWVANFSTEKSFDEIFNFYNNKLKEDKWIVKRRRRADEGSDTESILLEATKGIVKFTIFVSKETIRTQRIKTTVTKIVI